MKAEVKRLFELASELAPREREAFLSERCSDTMARLEVESLLEYATGTESLFQELIQDAAQSLRAEGEFSPGDCVGAYRIISLIGHGGMGTVYLAERADGAFHQQVAIKVLQSADVEFLQERFGQERHILARLNHPNIARIYDGGQTADGLPWFAMEYVHGDAIDRFCTRRNLAIYAKLELFLKVCDGVRHAHQSLIVHRDIKPANIAVTEFGVPKLLDFGIAKILDPARLEGASTRLLTPEYASPEQIRGDSITTATDIYSLGAVLYTLLTGRPPHCLSEMAPLHAARIISEQEAPIASSVLAGVPGDVDAILQKALHKDAARRYPSVDELVHDIRRYLEGRPVLAAPDRFGYRARRFLKRNALVAALSALASASLIAGTLISLKQAQRAEHRFQQVRQLANVFLFDFEKSIENVPGTLEARKLVAATAQQYLEQLAAESTGDASLQREIATAYERLSDVQQHLQSGNASQDEIGSLLKAYQIRRDLGDDHSDDPDQRRTFIRIASTVAALYQKAKNSSEAERWDSEAVRLARDWVTNEPDRREGLEAAMIAFMHQGTRLETAGQAARSVEAMRDAIDYGERARKAGADGPQTAYYLASAESRFANMLLSMKRAPEALLHAERAIALSEPAHQAEPWNQKFRIMYLVSLSSAGIANRALAESGPRHLPLAVEFLQRSHSIASDMARKDPKDAIAQDHLVTESHRLANALIQSGRLKEAARLYEQAGHAARGLIELNPNKRRYWYLAAANQVAFGDLRLHEGRFAEAQQLLLSADGAFERALAFDPYDAVLLENRAAQLQMIAIAAEKQGNFEAARRSIDRCLDVLAGMIERDPSAKSYVGDYREMIMIARRLGVSTGSLPEP